jgi:hypothetical protein
MQENTIIGIFAQIATFFTVWLSFSIFAGMLNFLNENAKLT